MVREAVIVLLVAMASRDAVADSARSISLENIRSV